MNYYTFEEIEIGTQESFVVYINEVMMESFKTITSDINPLHIDSEYAKSMNYLDRVVHGMLTASFLSTLAGVYLPGKHSLIHHVEIDFTKPVYLGDYLTVIGSVKEKDNRFKLIEIKVKIVNQKGATVCRAKMKIGVSA